MKKIIVGLFVIGLATQFGLTTQSNAQVVVNDGMLPEIEVHALNYKYLNSVDNSEAPVAVKLLEQKVANYDIKESELYSDDYDYYNVSFYIPEGKIVAAYDEDGKLIRTIEKFHDIAVPKSVAKSVAKRFPGWTIYKDVYLVNYHKDAGVTKQEYKLTLENGDKRMKVKTDKDGNFI
ncbi:MAG: nicotinate-nucleotide adenylyltransferase [Flavobacteriaceae bacterium]|nr:nicotinate-nucleotide adenylyltransferase [Flavobacteriaceae bacterium]